MPFQDWKFSEPLQAWDPGLINNPLGIINGLVPNQTNISTAQASQPTNISNSPVLKRNFSSLSGTERAERKRKIDQAYRERCKVTIPSLSHLISLHSFCCKNLRPVEHALGKRG